MTRAERTIAVSACVGLACAARVTWAYWRHTDSLFLRMKSSVWVALAWTFAHGEFYRPVLGAGGYGGTRYMPLFFVLHGALIRAGADPIWSGVALMHLSVAAAAVALFAAQRQLDVPTRLALPVAAMVWATVIFQQSATDLSPDYLAAALALFAATAAMRGRSIGAACLFVSAAATKLTAIAFAAPIVAVLWCDRRRSDSRGLALSTLALFVGVTAAIDLASAGRFHRALVSGTAAGLTAREGLDALPQFAFELAIKPIDVALPFAAAVWCAVARRAPAWAAAYLVTAALVAIAIFAAPGTASNHLVDLHLASLLVVGAALARGGLPARAATGMFAAIAVMLVAITIPLPGVPSVVAEVQAALPRPREAAISAHADLTRGPYLAIDPIVPVLNGDRPWVVDYGSLERFYAERTPAGLDLESRVRRHFFSAIVVPDGYESDLMPLLRSEYPRALECRPFVVLRSAERADE